VELTPADEALVLSVVIAEVEASQRLRSLYTGRRSKMKKRPSQFKAQSLRVGFKERHAV
jgi:hypothetical protein